MLGVSRPRSSVKEQRIIAALRSRIVQGEYVPGSLLPKREVLEQQFEVSPVTMRKALNRLVVDGFVQARPGKGTFVTHHPPHLSRYAVVFPFAPTSARVWSRFYDA